MNRTFLSQRFDDFDHLKETVRAWDLDFRQLDRGTFEGRVLQKADEKLLISYARFNRTLEQRGSAPRDAWTFSVPAPHSPPFRWRNRRMTPNRIAAFRPGSELDAVSKPGFEIFTLSVPEESLVELRWDPGEDEIMVVPSTEMHVLRQRISGFIRSAADGCDVPGGIVVEALLSCLRRGGNSRARRQERRHLLMARIEAFLAAHPREPVTVQGLVQVFDVNERTLRRAFKDRFGISPKAYLTALRLNGARRELRSSSPYAARVAEIARAWGFEHAGQFSVRYKAQFGESPSEALHRSP